MTASEIMTRNVKTIGAHASLRDLAELLTSADISGVPVVDNKNEVVGDEGWKLLARDLMTRKVATAHENTPVEDVSREDVLRALSSGRKQL